MPKVPGHDQGLPATLGVNSWTLKNTLAQQHLNFLQKYTRLAVSVWTVSSYSMNFPLTYNMWVIQRHLSLLLENVLFKAVTLVELALWEE